MANQLLAPRMVLASRIIDGPNPLRPNSIAVRDEHSASGNASLPAWAPACTLEDICNIRDVRAVLLGGKLFDAAELDRMRASTEERIAEHERRSE